MSTEQNDHAKAAAALRLVLEGVTASSDVEADEVHVACPRGAADALKQVAAANGAALPKAFPGGARLPVVTAQDAAGTSALPVSEVLAGLAGLSIPALPEGTTPNGLMALVRLEEPDGGMGWAVRVTANLDDDELLGVLTGYVESLRQAAAASWEDVDTTRAGE